MQVPKSIQANHRKLLRENIKSIETELMRNLERAFKSGALPEHWIKKDNHLLVKSVIDNYCLSRPFRLMDESFQKESDNLRKFL